MPNAIKIQSFNLCKDGRFIKIKNCQIVYPCDTYGMFKYFDDL